jgi:hypothetical protein
MRDCNGANLRFDPSQDRDRRVRKMSEPSDTIVKRRPMIDMDEFERRLRKPLAPSQREDDALAELARFVSGHEDPYKTVFEPLNKRSAAALGGGPERAEASPRGAQEPLIRGDFAAIEAGLLGGGLQPNMAGQSESFELSGGDEARREDDWRYLDSAEDTADPGSAFEEVRSRRPLYLMAFLIVAGIAGIGASFAFKGAISSQREIATIKAADGPAKIAAQTVPGSDNPSEGASILGDASQQPPAAVADKVEQPADLSAQANLYSGQANPPVAAADAAGGVMASGAASVPVPPPPAQAQAQPSAEPNSIAALIEPKKVKTVSVRPDGTLVPNDSPPQLASAGVPVPPAHPAAPAAKAATPKSAARVATTPKPPVAGANGNVPAPRTSIAAKAKPVQLADAGDQAPADAAPQGSFSVQFAAPGTEQEARDIQVRLMKKFGAEFAGFHPSIHKAEVGGKPVYRVRQGGLPSREEATALCQKVQSNGGNCFVAKN